VSIKVSVNNFMCYFTSNLFVKDKQMLSLKAL